MLNTQRLYELTGEKQSLQTQKASLLAELEQHEDTMSFEEQGYEVLAELQREFANKSVALYSELLSAIVRDVMGDSAPGVELEPSVTANKPALNIHAIVDGRKEDVVDSHGGAFNNLLAAGFRFIALALSSDRRFVILDEPDCWLSVELVPTFVQVLDSLCEKMGVQAVFISHHEQAKELPIYKVDLRKNAKGVIQAHPKDDREKGIDNADSRFNTDMLSGMGIQSIRLQNFMSHDDTYIPLSSGLTALIGVNNLGKSVVTRALSELLSNQRIASRIKHDTDLASVTLTLENDVDLIWSLQRKKSGHPLATYVIKDASGEVLELFEKTTNVPDVVLDYLQMQSIDDSQLDVHIGHQKDPLFLLNPGISKFKRAEMVKLGDDYTQIVEATKKHRENILEAKRTHAYCKKQLDTINSRLTALQSVSSVLTLCEQTNEAQQAINATDETLDKIALLSQTEHQRYERESAKAVTQALATVLNDSEAAEQQLTQQQQLLEKVLTAGQHNNQHVMGAVRSLIEELGQKDRQMNGLGQQSAIIERVLMLEALPKQGGIISSIQQMMAGMNTYAEKVMSQHKLLVRLLSHQEALSVGNTEIEKLQQQLNQTDAEVNQIMAKHGGVCPLCERPINNH